MKIKIFLFILFLIIPCTVKGLDINSKNAILYNLNNNEIIYEKNSDEVIKIASLTKMMTTIVALENINNLDDKVMITSKMLEGLIEKNASVAGFKVGDIVTYKDLLHGAMLPSGADATQALAISVSGNIDDYVLLMNNKAKQLKLTNTYFTNTTGLDEDNNHSTVKDVAILLQYALSNDTFKKIFQTRYYETTNGLKLISKIEENSLKYNIDTSIVKGAKTGMTYKAGLCLASVATFNDIDYLLVTAGADINLKQPLNIIDSLNIYDYYFKNYRKFNILTLDKNIITLDNKYSKEPFIIKSPIDYSLYMLKSDYEKLEYQYEGLNVVSIFDKNKLIGNYNIKLNGKIIKTINIYGNDIEFSVYEFIKSYIYIFALVTISFILLIFLKYRNIRLKKN